MGLQFGPVKDMKDIILSYGSHRLLHFFLFQEGGPLTADPILAVHQPPTKGLGGAEYFSA